MNGELDVLLRLLGAANATRPAEAGRRRLWPGSGAEPSAPAEGAARPFSVAHVLQLVRDPRAVLASWQGLPDFHEFRRHTSGAAAHALARQLCRKAEQDRAAGLEMEAERARRARTASDAWSSGGAAGAGSTTARREVRYALLRYEDLALSPVQTARQLYARLGLELHPQLLRWINASTHAQPGAARTRGATSDPHATTRDAATQVAKWRKDLSPRHIVAVTLACRGLLTALGYETDLRRLVPEEYQYGTEEEARAFVLSDDESAALRRRARPRGGDDAT